MRCRRVTLSSDGELELENVRDTENESKLWRQIHHLRRVAQSLRVVVVRNGTKEQGRLFELFELGAGR